MTTLTLIAVIFYLNGIVTHMTMSDTDNVPHGTKMILFVFYSLFGFAILTFAILSDYASEFQEWFSHTLQIKFWFRYRMGYYENLTEEALERLNNGAKTIIGQRKNYNEKMHLQDWHYIYCLRVIRDKYKKTD